MQAENPNNAFEIYSKSINVILFFEDINESSSHCIQIIPNTSLNRRNFCS